MSIQKQQVEELLNHEITDEQFNEALVYAKRKQAYIYKNDGREVVMEDWYLIQLTKETVISLAFSKFTQDLCMTLYNMEKEHSVKDQSTPSNHIVSQLHA